MNEHLVREQVLRSLNLSPSPVPQSHQDVSLDAEKGDLGWGWDRKWKTLGVFLGVGGKMEDRAIGSRSGGSGPCCVAQGLCDLGRL